MSTNCSRTSFCDYSAGPVETKTVFYTAAVLYSAHSLHSNPATVLLSSFVIKQNYEKLSCTTLFF